MSETDSNTDNATQGSAATAEPPTPAPPEESTAEPTAAEVEKWKQQSRKWEKRAKENSDAAARLADLEAANQTEQEKAITAAVAKARQDVLVEVGQQLAAAKIEASLTGVVEKPRRHRVR